RPELEMVPIVAQLLAQRHGLVLAARRLEQQRRGRSAHAAHTLARTQLRQELTALQTEDAIHASSAAQTAALGIDNGATRAPDATFCAILRDAQHGALAG